MATPRLTEQAGSQPEVRLELTNAEGRQVWALYSERPETAPPPTPAAGRFLEDLLAIAWRRRRLILAGAGVGAALGVAYLIATPSIYVIRALVHIEQRDSVLQQYDAVRAASTFIATQSEVLHSPSIVNDTFDALGDLVAKPQPGILKRVKTWVRSHLPFVDPAAAGDERAAAVMAALASLDATPVVGTEVMAITYRTIDPQGGVAFLDSLIGRYREYVRELETRAHIEGLALLREQDQELGHELDRLEAQWDELHAHTLALGQDENALSVQKLRLEEHARASVAAQGRRIELENRLGQLRQNGATLPQKDQLVEELRATEAALAELRAGVSDRHPDVRRMEQKVALLKQQMQRDSATQLDELEGELRAARRTEQQLERLYDSEWASAKELEVRRMRELDVRREIERIESKRDAVLALLRDKELRVLSLQSGHSGTVVHVLDPPAIPPEAVWPVPGMVLSVFAFLGAVGGALLALGAERKLRAAAAAAETGLWRR
jgi:uncharacterized protein involved in exopolysaccharide biosynthesis